MLREWRPILEGRDCTNALDAVNGISHDLEKLVREQTLDRFPPSLEGRVDPYLAGGLAGIALFFSYLALARGNGKTRTLAMQVIAEAADRALASGEDYGLLTGIAGVAWTLEHLRGLFPNEIPDDPLSDFDSAVLAIVSQRQTWKYDFDVFHGLVGLGIYALERLPRAQPKTTLELIIAHLSRLAESSVNGVTWSRLPPGRTIGSNDPTASAGEYVDLGMARGLASIIGLLGRVYRAGVCRSECSGLLEGAVRWLFSHRLSPASASWFPMTDDHAVPVYTAWCYGDGGVLAALFHAATAANRADWYSEALTLARDIAGRTPPPLTVCDASICHGPTGVAHLLNRIYHETSDETLARGARKWLRNALSRRALHGPAIGGFLFEWDESKWTSIPGLLRGVSGVGLALIAAATSIRPDWDRALLLSS